MHGWIGGMQGLYFNIINRARRGAKKIGYAYKITADD